MCMSPLTGSEDITLLNIIPAEKIIRDWLHTFKIDTTEELRGYKEIYLYQCNETKLKFFYPHDINGSEKIYKQLEKFDWYYLPHRWEHSVAIQDMRKDDRVLEIGCGFGEFVERLRNEEQIDAHGIELNSSAVKEAKKLGRSVKRMSIDEALVGQYEAFDVVCSFQVLEHVPHLKEYISACIDLLKSGGRLLVCVPNNDGFIRLAQNNLLNQPPHHLSLWSKCVFKYLPQYFPIKLKRIFFEPLASYHLDWYTNIQLNRLPRVRFFTGFVNRSIRNLVLPIFRLTGWHKVLQGHSIYVCYQKIN